MNTKSKISRSRRGARRAHKKASIFQVKSCPNCSAEMLHHTVCLSCGFYKGRQVLTPKVKEEEQTA